MTSRRQTSSLGLNRRYFMSLCGAGAVYPAVSGASATVPSDPDVVIVGAGAAGIAAAHVLREQGVSYVQIEAGAHVGGRAWTENETFGVPFDHGAHWVQSETRNPYFNRAKTSGHRFYEAPETYGIYADDGPATAQQEDALWSAWDDVYGAITTAGRKGQDVSPASVAPGDGPWDKTAWFGIGPWEMGKDMEDFSCKDWYNSADSNDWYCAEGYGRLVADYAAGLPIHLKTPATRIVWSGKGVEIDTPGGTIRAKAVILTVSTGVLAGGDLAFDPPLPVETQDAIQGITMGDYNHIALQFDEDIFDLGEDGYVLHRVADGKEGMGILTNASGTGLAYCDVGGSFARDLERAGEAAALDYALGKLRSLIGADVDKHYVAGAVTMWTADPLFRGCYASAVPGAHPMRAVLRQPVGDRIFFAGEACHPSLWATVGGADLSGAETAAKVARVLT